MTLDACPEEGELFTSIDEPELAESARVRDHLAGCRACQEKVTSLTELLADVREPVRAYPAERVRERVTAAITRDQARRRKGPRKIALAGAITAALAVAAMSVLVPRAFVDQGAGEFTPRGGKPEPGARRDVGLTLDVVTRSPAGTTEVAPATADAKASSRSHLLLSYATPRATQPFHLLCFAVDVSGEVHWLYPAYEDASSDPASIVLPPGRALAPMGEEILLDGVPEGILHVYAVVGPRPLRVSDVERLTAQELEPASLAQRFPGSDVRSWDLRLAADVSEETP